MNICIIGGGNIGTVLAGELGKKHSVTMFTSKPYVWKNTIHVINREKHTEYDGHLELVTDDAQKAVQNAQIVYITVPSHIVKQKLEEIELYVKPGAYIGIVPGTGGCEFYAKKLIQKGIIFFGMQRVPYIVRLKEYGSSVYNLSTKKN